MELSRIKVLYGGLILQLLFTIAVPLPYNKYGRQCSDIGCLSNQVCVMAYDSCSLSQREGSECGRYPTCKKNTEAGLAAGPSDTNTDLYSNTPDRPKPASSSSSDDDVLASLGIIPSNPGPNNRPSAPQPGNTPYQNPYPTLPPRQPVQPAQPQYPGVGGGGSGHNNYYGGGGGGSSYNGGNRGQFDGAGGHIVVPSPKPPTPSSGAGGGFFGGILGGIQNAVSNAVKQQVGTYINQRLGIGPAAGQAGGAGGLGGLLDARNFIDQKKFGGLFSEKPAAGSSGSSAGQQTSGVSGGHPYPVTVDQRPIQSVTGQQQYAGRSSESYQYGQRQQQQQSQQKQGTPAPYGWKLD